MWWWLKHSNKGHKSVSRKKKEEDMNHEKKEVKKKLLLLIQKQDMPQVKTPVGESEIHTFSPSATQTSHNSPEKQIHKGVIERNPNQYITL